MNDISKAYNSTSLKANYLISTGLSNAGAIFCNYGSQNRYTHGKSIAAFALAPDDARLQENCALLRAKIQKESRI